MQDEKGRRFISRGSRGQTWASKGKLQASTFRLNKSKIFLEFELPGTHLLLTGTVLCISLDGQRGPLTYCRPFQKESTRKMGDRASQVPTVPSQEPWDSLMWCWPRMLRMVEHKVSSGVWTKNEADIFITQPLSCWFLLPSPVGFIFCIMEKQLIIFRNSSQAKIYTNMRKSCKDRFHPIIQGSWLRPEQDTGSVV